MSSDWLKDIELLSHMLLGHLRTEGRYLNYYIQAWWVDQTSFRMQRTRYRTSKLPSIQSKNVNSSLGGSHQNVIFAGMHIETSYLTFINNELSQRSLVQLWPFYVNLGNTHAVWGDRWDNPHSEVECTAIQHRGAIHEARDRHVSNISKSRRCFPIFYNSHLDLKLRWVAESLSISLDMADEVKAIFDIIATDESTFEGNDGVLLIGSNENLNDWIFFRRDLNPFN